MEPRGTQREIGVHRHRRQVSVQSSDTKTVSETDFVYPSGLIIHRSYLPLLSSLLKNYSSRDFDPDAYRPAPDQVVQECLLGRESSPCRKQDVPKGESRMIISSRLVLDHIGGMATTSQGKALNSDKWRCGWRHPFHGDELVEVVIV